MNLHEIEEKKITDQIYTYIKSQILDEHYKVEEKIPERIICETFNTSRTTVRTAISKLKDEGWLYVKAKSGTYVASIDKAEMKENFEVRLMLEPAILAMAIPNITKDDIDEMRNTCKEMSLVEDINEFQKLEQSIHDRVELRCGNRLLVNIMNGMVSSYQRLSSKTTKNVDRREDCVREWKKIIDAVEAKDVEYAKQRMLQHILNATDLYWENF